MRYWSYNEQTEKDGVEGNVVLTVSDEDILKEYWPYWYEKMCEKFGKEHVDANYCPEDCIDDFVVIHWAWESK